MKKGFVTPGQETHQNNPMPVDDKGFIYTKGGKLPFRVRKGAGIYDHATDQFKLNDVLSMIFLCQFYSLFL